MGWMMAGMLTQLPLPLLLAGAVEIAPGPTDPADVQLLAAADGEGAARGSGPRVRRACVRRRQAKPM